MLRTVAIALYACFLVSPRNLTAETPSLIQVSPSAVQLSGAFDRLQLVVTLRSPDGSIQNESDDLTNKVTYRSSADSVVRVDVTGQMRAMGNGDAVRAIGDPAKRFEEDKLRILRAIRFGARLGYTIERDTWDAVCAMASQIHQVSVERIQGEIVRILTEGQARHGVRIDAPTLRRQRR